jgi:hypothetical protein
VQNLAEINLSGIVKIHMDKFAERQVGKQHAERNGQKKQWLEALLDCEENQDAGDEKHDEVLPLKIGKPHGTDYSF